MTAIRTLLVTVLLATATCAHAQWYGTLALGVSDAKTTNVSGTEPSINFGAGYQFNKYLALEATYLALSRYESQSGSTTFTWKATGLGAMAVGFMPLGINWRLVGKAGVYALRSRDTEAVGSNTIRSDDNSMTIPSFALGVDYAFVDTTRARLLLEHIDGDKELDSIQQVSVGIVVGF